MGEGCGWRARQLVQVMRVAEVREGEEEDEAWAGRREGSVEA
jgi:hypothetical protein